MKNNWIRILTILTIALVLVLTLASCSEKENYWAVYFEWNDGNTVDKVQVAEGEIPTVPTPERFGYTFVGWFADAALTTPVSPETIPVTSEVSYYAAWTSEQNILISFDSCGGSSVSSAVIKKGEILKEAEIAAPTKEGYTFNGWYKNEACTSRYSFDTVPVENLTLYAAWKLNTGMGECIGIVDGHEIARTVFKAGAPVLPTTEDGISYIWYVDPSMTTPFEQTNVASSVTLYGVAYTAGLEIQENRVVGYVGESRNVIVPDVWQGVIVTEIADYAFAGNEMIKSVKLPTTVTKVGESAFYRCSSLNTVNLTENCTSLGAFSFCNCKKMESLGDLSGITIIPDSAFLGCERLIEVLFAKNLQSIGQYAFADCSSIVSFDLPDTVISIGEYAFSGCYAVEEFHIPRGLVTFGTGALHGCAALSKLTYSDNNDTAFYRVIDGNLYEGNGKKLVLYVCGDKTETTFTLPQGANAVAPYAFSGNTNLKELILDDEKYTIEKGALAGMKALEKLSIYTLDGDNGYLAYYFGAESGEANGSAGNFSPDTLQTVSLKKAAGTLPDYAFYGFRGLREVEGLTKLRKVGKYAFAYTALVDVTIPATLASIGEKAYYGCSATRSFTVEAGNTSYAAFDGCLYNKALTSLYLVPLTKTEVTFPETIDTITAGCFYKSNVRRVIVPESVTKIESGAFAGVLRLEELTVPFIGGSATENTYMIYIFGGTVQTALQSDGTTSYSTGNTSCTPASLKKLTVTSEITNIPDFAFAYLSSLNDIILSGKITSIGNYAYCQCGLTELVLPSTVKKIGEYAFAAMDKLENATIPGSVGGNLGVGLFYNCQKLETVVFEEGVTLIPENALYPSSSRDAETDEINYYSSLKSITLPSTVEKIGAYAFAYAGTSYIGDIGSTYSTELKFVLPSNSHVQTVEEGAFYRSSIASIHLPACLKSIEKQAFLGCRNLASVTIGVAENGASIERFGGAAFAFCAGLKKLTIYKEVSSSADIPAIELYTVSSTVENYEYNLFHQSPYVSIYVTNAEAYRKTTNWEEYDVRLFSID